MAQLRIWLVRHWKKVLIAIIISSPLLNLFGFYPWIRWNSLGWLLWSLFIALLMLNPGLRRAIRRSPDPAGCFSIGWIVSFAAIILVTITLTLTIFFTSPSPSDPDDLTLRTDDHFYYATFWPTWGTYYVLYECDRLPLFCERVVLELHDYPISEDTKFALVADGKTVHIMRDEEAALSYSPADE